MDADQLKAYRRMGVDRLEQLLIALPDQPHEADYFVDNTIRILSELPPRPEGDPPYKGLYGEKGDLDEYRDVAVDRLEDLIIPLAEIQSIDGEIDDYIRLLSDLPERSSDREPYTGLFVLREAPDEVDLSSGASSSAKKYITTEQLVQIAGTSEFKSRLAAFTDGVNATFDQYEINTPLRMAHFLAQIMHESGGFRWLREIWGPTATQRGYEGRSDLGNNQPGDGKRFMGRGLIQLTGRNNYTQFKNAIGVDVVSNPVLVEQPPYAVIVAGWFWDSRGLNKYADLDDLRQVTRRINGGYNGLKDREKYLKRAKLVLR